MTIFTAETIANYFNAKRRELMALAELAVCEHPGLKGSHREQIYRAYLSDILPKRYSVGRGMVYGLFHRSREADIVIWDSHSYPSLPLLDHAFFFAESVRAVIECKSNWTAAEMTDVLAKCKAVRDIVPHKEPSLADELAKLQLDVACLKAGRRHEGMLIGNHHIGTTAMFLRGGQKAKPEDLVQLCDRDLDDSWPDVLLLLEPGLLALKHYPGDEGRNGCIAFYEYSENALLAFSSALLKLLDDRVVHSEARFYLDHYVSPLLEAEPIYTHEFPLTRFPAGHVPLWR